MHKLNLAVDAICRFCKEMEEIPVPMPCLCEDLARIRFVVVGVEKPIAH